MICKNCNEENREGVKFCSHCGASLEETIPVETAPVVEQEVPAVEEPVVETAPVNESEKKNYKLIGIIASVAAVVLAIVTLFSIFGGSSDSVLKKYMKATTKFDIEKAVTYSYIDEMKVAKKKFGLSEKEINKKVEEAYKTMYPDAGIKSLDDLNKYIGTEMKKMVEGEYGEKCKVTYKVMDTRKLSKSEIETDVKSAKEEYDNMYSFDLSSVVKLNKVSHMNRYDVDMIIKGEDKEETVDIVVITAKVGGKWRIWSGGSMDMSTSILGIID